MSQVPGRCRWRRTLSVFVVLAGPTAAWGGTTVFVDPAAAPGGQGQSWESAYRSLQDALAFVRQDGEVASVHVAQGTYAPDEGETVITGDRRVSFRPISGVAIMGGFAGVAGADPDARDVVQFASILTGDLARNDGPGFSGMEENSHHVVTATNASDEAVLDGFTIRGGNANGPAPDERGGGIRISGGAPVLRDLVIEDNSAFFGGGAYIDRADPAISGVVFRHNIATFGGAIYADRSGLTASGVEVRSGEALAGGGVYVTGGAPAFEECVFFDNDADLDGGGVYASGAAPTFSDCEFRINTALFDGGAMYAVAGAPILDGCQFVTNFADEGGGLRCVGGTPAFDACTFSLNFARKGGAVNGSGGAAIFTGCAFDRNEAEEGGGVLTEDGDPAFVDCTFDRNEAIEGGGFHGTGGSPAIEGCVFTANEGGQRGGGISMRGGAAAVTDCTFTENLSVGFFISNGGGVDLLDAPGTTLTRCVFTANVANFGAGLAVKGDARVVECQFLDHVGFVGAGMYATEGAPVVERSVFRGNRTEGDVIASGGGVHVFFADITLEACVFETNSASTTGGAVHLAEGAATLSNCTLDGNTASDEGGGLFVLNGNALVSGCTFTGNQSDSFGGGAAGDNADFMYAGTIFAGNRGVFGGGVMNLQGDPHFVNCVFSGNAATGSVGEQGCAGAGLGGGLASIIGTPRLVGCTFASNTADCGGSGGGASVIFGEFVNCILWDNTDGGGGDESAQISGTLITVDFSCVQGLTGDLGGDGNIGADPLFVDRLGADGTPGTVDDDLRLGAGSSCVDAGNNGEVPADVTTDVGGLERFVDDPLVADTGEGEPPLVDLGAHERQASACPADIDGDGVVGMSDILTILVGWGPCPPKGKCPGDVNGNGAVDFADVLIALAGWGACP